MTWRLISEEPPPAYKNVLVYAERSYGDYYDVCEWIENAECWYDQGSHRIEDLTHWMPLPERPK